VNTAMNLWVPENVGNCSVVERLAASQEGPKFMKLLGVLLLRN
jgi:hypothetical protein